MGDPEYMEKEEIELLNESFSFFDGDYSNQEEDIDPDQQEPVPVKGVINENYEVGISTILNQRIKKFSREGLMFNLLVAGRVGSGKTTFINSIFDAELIENSFLQNTSLKRYECLIEDSTGVRLNLSIVETPGYGSKINNEYCWIPLINYLEEQMSGYVFQEEQPYRQGKIRDTRVHCCLYFIDAFEFCMHPIDVMTMREISNRCNLIPVISKSDYLTENELKTLKQKCKDVLRGQNIKVCKFFSSSHIARQYYYDSPYDIHIQRNQYHWQDAMEKRANSLSRHRNNLKYKQLRDAIFGDNLPEFVESTELHYERYRQFILEFRMKQYQSQQRKENNNVSQYQAEDDTEEMSTGIKEYLEYIKFDKHSVDRDLMAIANPTYLRAVFQLQKRYQYMLALEAQREEKGLQTLQYHQDRFALEIKRLRDQLESLRVSTDQCAEDDRLESTATLVSCINPM